MPFEHIAELTAWIKDAGLAELELTSPEARLVLRLGDDAAETALLDLEETAETAAIPLRAPMLGTFLHRHPMVEEPLFAEGQTVRTDQCLGLLRIGALLVPVMAPSSGEIAAFLVPHGETVGYGTALLTFYPSEQ